jgi:Tol biopolymer transport system component
VVSWVVGGFRGGTAGPVKRLSVVATLATVTLLGAIGIGMGGSAQAVVAGNNGRILFARCIAPFKCGSNTVASWEIVAANPNDTAETVLAGAYTRAAWDDHFIANWSPDGTRAIFMLNQGIWEVNADGSNLHLVWSPPPDGTGIDDGPAFTPDGKNIIFTRCCPPGYGYSLWEIKADGTGLRDVTREPVVNGDGPSDNLPQVSPDGKRIVFHRCFPQSFGTGGCEIVTVNLNGSNEHVLTDPSLNAQVPNWSPDSKHIVFEMYPSGTADIGIVNADGSGFVQLTSGGGRVSSFAASFSPDGTKIIFSRSMSTGGLDLFTMNPDGSHMTQITQTAAPELWPQWAVNAP